jgi:hypothetical protein
MARTFEQALVFSTPADDAYDAHDADGVDHTRLIYSVVFSSLFWIVLLTVPWLMLLIDFMAALMDMRT